MHMKKQIDSKLALKTIDLSYICSMQEIAMPGIMTFNISQEMESQPSNKSYYV